MRVLVAAAIFGLAAACTSSSVPVAGGSPTPQSSPPTSVSPSPSAAPDVTATSVGLSLRCRLPVTWAVQDGNDMQITKAGFATFPGQTLTEDPTAPSGSVLFYDRAFSRWLTVGRNSVSPDGRRYAYSKLAGNAYQNSGSAVHVVDIASGADRVIYNGGNAFSVLDFAAEGVYLTGATPEGYPRGLWLLALAGGEPRLISASIVSPAVGGGAAWGLDFNAADPSPGPGGLEGPRNRILRYDLTTGTATPWFYRPGASLYVVGFDASGHPFVTASMGALPTDPSGTWTQELWLTRSAVDATRLYAGASFPSPTRLAAVDSHGVWFDAPYVANSPSSVWLYSQGSIQLVALVNRGDVAVAGGCIPQ